MSEGLVEWLSRQLDLDEDHGVKRRIFDQHAPVIDGTQSSWKWFMGSESESEFTLQLLALLYADRPGYQEEWRP